MRRLRVKLGKRSYDIVVGTGLLEKLGQHCGRLGLGARCVVVTDRQVGRLYAGAALRSLRGAGFEPVLLTISPGEKAKNLRVVSRCYDRCARHRLERGSFVVALGGGVVGDLAGFVAATYLRGIPLVQVPTTLLSQVDSSVGGKVGVNLEAGKNLVGAFHQPRLVLCDLELLRSLPGRELRSGLAEVIKYGIIYDADLFRRLERDLDKVLALRGEVLGWLVARCCGIKAEVVRRDENEGGMRAILNFGHTLGHAIEAISGYGRYLHGEAIAIGQVAAAEISQRLTGLAARDVERIKAVFRRAGLPLCIELDRSGLKRLLKATRLDKKVQGGAVRFVLARRIGRVCWGQPVGDDEIRQAVMPRKNPGKARP